MSNIALTKETIPPMSLADIGLVRQLETEAMKFPQTEIETTHTFHAGLYARTVKIPAGVVITGTLIKIETVLIVSGDILMFADGEMKELQGYHVFSASAGRKQVFQAITDAYLTMLFSTKAETIEEAEQEFTDEAHLLITRREAE